MNRFTASAKLERMKNGGETEEKTAVTEETEQEVNKGSDQPAAAATEAA